MQFTTILPVALLSTLSLASPMRTLSKSQPSPALTWHVSNFNTGCSQGGCVYDFHILGVGTENTPGFNTTCHGVTDKDNYVRCRNQDIGAIVKPEQYPTWNVQVQHGWLKDGAEYWNDGSANTTSPAKSFTIDVEQQYGVA